MSASHLSSIAASAREAAGGSLRIAFCVPDMRSLQNVVRTQTGDAAYIQQSYIARGLQARGHRLTYVAPQDLAQIICTDDPLQPHVAPPTWSSQPWFELASKGTWRAQELLGLPYLNLFSNLRYYDACLRCLPDHDVVYERNGLYHGGISRACRRLGLPYVMFFDADQLAEHDFIGKPITGLLRRRAAQILRSNVRSATAIVTVTEVTRSRLTETWGAPEHRVFVLPNAVDVEQFRPEPERGAAVRASLGVGADPLLVFVGNFYEWHDVGTLLDAFTGVLPRTPTARLLLVGEGPRRAEMMKRATDAGLDHAVTFTGQLPHTEIPGILSAATVAVVPVPVLRQDLWLSPMKLFEYMASGVAIVASASGQVAEVIQDGRNGLLTPPGDAKALAGALNRLIANPDERHRLARQAREDAVQKHSWEQYACRLEEILRAAATEHKRSQPG